jgi:hypothetical protein
MGLLDGIGKKIYSGMTSKAGVGLIMGGAVAKGLYDTVGKSSIDNAMEIAFNDPEADRKVLGTDLSAGLLVAEGGFGPISAAAKAVNLDEYGWDTGMVGPSRLVGAIGGTYGALRGARGGASVKGKLIKGAIGGAIGTAAGSAIGGAAAIGGAVSYSRNNSQLMRESPFSNTSLATADALNASGDIVLGMHNSRRGY